MDKNSPPIKPGNHAGASKTVAGQVLQTFSHGRSNVVKIETKRRKRILTKESATEKKESVDPEKEARQKALSAAAKPGPTPQFAQPSSPLSALTPEQKNEPAAHQPPPMPSQTLDGPAKKDAHQGPGSRKFSNDDLKEKSSKKVFLKASPEEKHAPRNLARFYSLSEDIESPKSTQSTVSKKVQKKGGMQPQKTNRRLVKVSEKTTLTKLAGLMCERAAKVLSVAKRLGITLKEKENSQIDADTAELLVTELGYDFQRLSSDEEKLAEKLKSLSDHSDSAQQERPPVITIMGHVDHGKTSLLDALRRTAVTKKEAGGITQQIGAYQITSASGKPVTFIDTPGHAAFTQMRARGAHITDVVILLVAADDGVKEQTVEAIAHAKASGAPIIVAINKVDKPEANSGRVRQELLSHDITVESLGGTVQDVEVSAQTGQNLDKLIEAILLQAEILELKTSRTALGRGTVLEGRMDKHKGSVGTVLVRSGHIKLGQTFISGLTKGRVRSMSTDRGSSVKEALPSAPLEITGFSSAPMAGDDFLVVPSEADAQEILALKQACAKNKTAARASASAASPFSDNDQEQKELNIILRADTQGALEAIDQSLAKITHDEVTLKMISKGVGTPNESDLYLAQASQALLITFGVSLPSKLVDQAKRMQVDVQQHDVIYKLIDLIKDMLGGLLEPEKREVVTGSVEIRQIFTLKRLGQIAGCYVTNGLVKRGSRARIKRKGKVLFETTVTTLRREKNDAKEVKEGYECGITFDSNELFEVGDVAEIFIEENVRRTLEN